MYVYRYVVPIVYISMAFIKTKEMYTLLPHDLLLLLNYCIRCVDFLFLFNKVVETPNVDS